MKIIKALPRFCVKNVSTETSFSILSFITEQQNTFEHMPLQWPHTLESATPLPSCPFSALLSLCDRDKSTMNNDVVLPRCCECWAGGPALFLKTPVCKILNSCSHPCITTTSDSQDENEGHDLSENTSDQPLATFCPRFPTLPSIAKRRYTKMQKTCAGEVLSCPCLECVQFTIIITVREVCARTSLSPIRNALSTSLFRLLF